MVSRGTSDSLNCGKTGTNSNFTLFFSWHKAQEGGEFFLEPEDETVKPCDQISTHQINSFEVSVGT